MLKSVLYAFILLTTTARFIDIIYILAKDTTNLPIPVIGVTTAIIIYGIVLLVKKVIGKVNLKQMMVFLIAQSVAIVFNLAYVAIRCPLAISIPETLLVGTFLDIIVNSIFIYLCMKQSRSHYFALAQPVVNTTKRHAS